MAKFKTSPFYSVYAPSGKLTFDHLGEYVTDNADDIAVLKSLCPRYLTCTDEGKAETKQAEEAPAKPKSAPKKATASAK